MDEQAMLTRDLVLRLCANATEFDREWLRAERKLVVPFTATRDTSLIDAVVAAGGAMGVDRLLVCRTRAEFAYEPVTEVPGDTEAVVALIRSWGEDPTDFLVAVEDFSAAVLVTASALTVAAGPDDFLRPLVGADIAQARVDFAEEARIGRDPELLHAAQRYGCLEFGGRHARGRGPGPDLAERLAVRAEFLRENAPRTVAWLRALRGAWGWAMVAVLFLAAFLVPELPAALPVVLAMLWLLCQLAWPARSRTVSFATLVGVLALGALILGPVAVAQQALAATTGVPLEGWAGYTYIAVATEEIGKLVPPVLCWLVARRRFKRFAAVDYLLLAAASGAGFHLAEQGLRAVANGGSPALLDPQHGVFTLLPGWVGVPELGIHFSGHAVTTGLIGAALGLAIVGHRRYGAWLWLLPPLAVWMAALEHLVFNAVQAGVEPTPATALLFAFLGGGSATRWVLLLLLVIAVVMDYRLARAAAESVPPLPGDPPVERFQRWTRGLTVRMAARIPGDIAPAFRRIALVGVRLPVTLSTTLSSVLQEFALMVAAASRGPATLCRVWRFLRQRRAYAMGAVRAGERAWRRFPSRGRLSTTGRELASSLAPAAAAAVTASAALLVAVVPSAVPGAGPGGGAYAAVALREAGEWLATVPQGNRPWVWAATVALLSLLASGWRVPHAHPGMRHFLRAPSANISSILGAFAPGQVPYAVTGLTGMAVPRSASRLLFARRP